MQVKDAVNDCREFLRFVTKGFIVLAALELLGQNSVNDISVHHKTSAEKAQYLDNISEQIVERFVASEKFKFSNKGKETSKEVQRIPCGYAGCPKTFSRDGKCRTTHRRNCLYKNLEVLNINDNRDDVSSCDRAENDKKDEKFNYTCSVLRDGLFDWCREDAAKENDGDRLIRLWRFDFLRFSLNNHIKYRLLSFKLQSQLMALLPPRQAHQLRYNRCVSIHGGSGSNVPGDLALEFFNMRAKDALTSLRGNLTASAIER